MRAKKLLGLILILGTCCIAFAGCDTPEPQTSEYDLLAAAGDTYFSSYSDVNWSAETLFEKIAGNEDVVLYDWRSAEDYAAAHVIGAINAALSDIDTILPTLPTDKKIVNICYTGQNASFATAVMRLYGLDASNLLFGMCSIVADESIVPKSTRWQNAIETDEFADRLESTVNEATETYEEPDPGTGMTTLQEIIVGAVDGASDGWSISAADVFGSPDSYFIINYWPQDQYLDPGHIQGAVQFTPKADLASAAKLNLIPTDKTVVVYCYTGQTSAQVAAYLRMLGYDAKSLLYGIDGFAHELNPGGKYSPPASDLTSILE